MNFIDKIKERAKSDKKRIVLPESMDKRVIEAAEKIIKEDIAEVIIIGKKDEILEISNQSVLTAVKLLTKQKNFDMKNYIDGIKGNDIAFVVKNADRLHNLQSALVTSVEFKRKYVLETVDWYLDFSKEIKIAVKKLAESLESPILELSFL